MGSGTSAVEATDDIKGALGSTGSGRLAHMSIREDRRGGGSSSRRFVALSLEALEISASESPEVSMVEGGAGG